ncbi:putative cysteine-rich repeat secretory protein 38-like [Capsicum annuum]|uniref:uclacyanin 1 n=1 Tax=Capsicum annuum TaxID=4072 RepID=UPI001FB093CE|nr:uclacyanin 1 [Capsicum annuum]KAF3622607.1 putative cysteine-rich repeat secretory protein 38-like [Capsicum annuum]KAF3634655.1 putative cysteine-rich repeat secretory protein 38-like [Capsicum annuum]
MAMLRMLMSLAAIAMLVGSAIATNYTVGGPNGGWDQSTDVQAWAASKTFYVGDKLIFSYALSHSVLEVTKAGFESCQITSPIAIYTGGMSVITLATVGKRYFICGTGGHCNVGGMKLEINTLPKPSPPPPAKPATPPTATPTTPPPSTPSSPPPSTPSNPPPSSPMTPPPTPKTPAPSNPTTPPASSPSTTPVASPPSSSPSPKSSSAPSPKQAPKVSPALSPSKSSHAHSPVMPPTGVPTSPSVEAPGLPPTVVPTSPSVEAPGLPPSGASAPTPSSPSSAHKISVVTGSTVGFCFAIMLMFLL